MTTDAGAAGTVRSKRNMRAADPHVRDDSGNTAARAVNVGQRVVTGVAIATRAPWSDEHGVAVYRDPSAPEATEGAR